MYAVMRSARCCFFFSVGDPIHERSTLSGSKRDAVRWGKDPEISEAIAEGR